MPGWGGRPLSVRVLARAKAAGDRLTAEEWEFMEDIRMQEERDAQKIEVDWKCEVCGARFIWNVDPADVVGLRKVWDQGHPDECLVDAFSAAALGAFNRDQPDVECECGDKFAAENLVSVRPGKRILSLREWKTLTRLWWKLHCGPGHGLVGRPGGGGGDLLMMTSASRAEKPGGGER